MIKPFIFFNVLPKSSAFASFSFVCFVQFFLLISQYRIISRKFHFHFNLSKKSFNFPIFVSFIHIHLSIINGAE